MSKTIAFVAVYTDNLLGIVELFHLSWVIIVCKHLSQLLTFLAVEVNLLYAVVCSIAFY
jgi:hypothetical protein